MAARGILSASKTQPMGEADMQRKSVGSAVTKGQKAYPKDTMKSAKLTILNFAGRRIAMAKPRIPALNDWAKIVFIVLVFCFAMAITSPAQTYTTLLSFDGSDGQNPNASLVQGTNGNLYATTFGGGAHSPYGTVFEINPGGTLTTLYSFCAQTKCSDGDEPVAAFLLDSDGNLYSTTFAGGTNGYGTVFKITPGGTLTTLHNFNMTDGAYPSTGVVQATNGSLYGTTRSGGGDNDGTVFNLTVDGTLMTLHSFDRTDGYEPNGPLIQATDGNFYGTTYSGGTNGYGTAFKITPGGTLTTLYSFCSQTNCTDGALPGAGVVQAANGNLYGTTTDGGTNGYGTVFEINSAGRLTTLHSFDGTDGYSPMAPLIQATDGNFYGTTYLGGTNCCGRGRVTYGTVFKVTPSGTLTTLHSFDGGDGDEPFGALFQATSGTFYGTTFYGGARNDGTVFSLSVGLDPFVETTPTSGQVGTKVLILANTLTGTSSVTFHGISATFTVVSETEITTTVPTGATSGTVEVTTPGGVLTSNVAFHVIP